MKKIIALFAALLMLLSLSACKKESEDVVISDTSIPTNTTSSPVSQENSTQTESEEDTQGETKAETPVDDISSVGDNVINAGDLLGGENAESSKKPSSSSSSKKPSSSSSSSKKPSSSSSKVDPPDDAAQDMEVESKKEQFTPYV